MADIERILQGLHETMTVMEELQRRQAARSQEHQKWLEDLTAGWSRHEQAMSELDEKLNILANSQLTLTNTVNRFIESLQARNGH
jgi:chromosome segregation ATPase